LNEQAAEQAFMSALTTEHFVMQSVASTTVSEASSRASLYLASLSSSLVAIGFSAQSPAAFPFIVAAVAPAIFVLGVFTAVRLVDTGVENIQAQRAIARIRRHYATLTPEARRFFGPPPEDISEEALGMIGVRPGRFLLLFTMASMVGAVNAFVGGAGLALLIVGLAGFALLPVGILVGLAGAGIVLGLTIAYQRRRYALMDREWRARWAG
jgi:hypothetical protein